MADRPRLPGNLDTNRRLALWVRFEADRTVTLFSSHERVAAALRS
jgi:hypothetical protein